MKLEEIYSLFILLKVINFDFKYFFFFFSKKIRTKSIEACFEQKNKRTLKNTEIPKT